MSHLISLRGAVLGGLVAASLAGSAHAGTVDLGTLTVNPAAGASLTFTSGGLDHQLYYRYLDVPDFQLSTGDIVAAHIALTSPLTVPSGGQSIIFTLEDGPFSAFNMSVSGAMQFANGSGGPNGAGYSPTGSSGSFSNVYSRNGASFTIVDLDSSAIYTWMGPNQIFTHVSLSYDVTNPGLAATPLPGTLPLFASGLGAVGLLAHRRRKRKPMA